ncbi:MAG: hypothetical protein ABIV63_18850 [Caldimonas sp.]
MTGVVGTLYQDSAARVCNAYRLDDQQDLGLALALIAIATAALWLTHVALRDTRNGCTAGLRLTSGGRLPEAPRRLPNQP